MICYQFLNRQVSYAAERETAPEKPRFIIVGFQTAKDGDKTKNPFTYDHVNLKNAYVTLNSDRYPAVIIICLSPTRNIIGCMLMQPCLELNSLVWMS